MLNRYHGAREWKPLTTWPQRVFEAHQKKPSLKKIEGGRCCENWRIHLSNWDERNNEFSCDFLGSCFCVACAWYLWSWFCVTMPERYLWSWNCVTMPEIFCQENLVTCPSTSVVLNADGTYSAVHQCLACVRWWYVFSHDLMVWLSVGAYTCSNCYYN